MALSYGLVRQTSPGRALVKSLGEEHCEGCSAKHACQSLGGGSRVQFEVVDRVGVAPGDLVELFLPGGTHLEASVLVFLVPILGLIAGAGLGGWLAGLRGWPVDLSSVIGGLCLLAACLVLAWLYDRRARKDPRYTMSISRVIRSSPPPCGAEIDIEEPERPGQG